MPVATAMDAATAQQLAGVVPQIYSALSGSSAEEVAAAKGVLEGGNCVWVGNGFVAADKVAFKVRHAGVLQTGGEGFRNMGFGEGFSYMGLVAFKVRTLGYWILVG